MKEDVSIWLPVYIGDMLAMTTRLSTEQIGGLYLLMMDYWKNGTIPNDVKTVSAITRLPTTKAKVLIQAITETSIFVVQENGLISPYLDDKKSQATENKTVKSEKAKKAAEARWSKNQSEQCQENTNIEHNSSNAQAMQTQCVSNATDMLEQCPSTSTLSINNIHTQYAGEPNNEQSQSELDVMAVMNLWNPTMHDVNSALKISGLPEMTEHDFNQIKFQFLSHYKPMLENNSVVKSQLFSKLVGWIKRGKTTPKKQTQSTFVKQNSSNTRMTELEQMAYEAQQQIDQAKGYYNATH